MPTNRVDVELDTVAVPCTTGDLKATFGWLLMEMRSVARVLRADERNVLRKIMSHAGAPLTVKELFPGFERESEAHKTLRRLRATQFVYPKKSGRWEPDEPIEVTPFARLVWTHLGEARIFSPAPDKPKGVPVDVRTPPPKAAPVTWDNLMDRISEQQRKLAASSAKPRRG